METLTKTTAYPFLEGGGEMGELTRNFEWSETSLGPIDTWPQSLRTTLSILLHSSFPVFFFWTKDLICFYNDAFRPSLGIDGKHPAIGKKGKDVWPEIWDFIGPLIRQVMETGEPVWFENQLVPFYRNGRMEDIYWTFSYSPAYDDECNINGVFVTCMETTQAILDHKNLKESREQLSFAIEAAELATWDFNPITNKFIGNARYAEWFGLPADKEIDNDLALNIIAEEDRPRVIEAYTRALEYDAKANYDIEFKIRPLNIPERVVRAKGKAYFNEDKMACRFTGTLQDVTEQSIASKKILQSEQRFEAAIDAIEGILWTNSAEGQMLGEQPGWTKLTGQRYEDYQGYGWSKAVHPDDAEPTIDAWNEAVKERKTFVFEHRVKKKNGSFGTFSIRAIPLPNEDGSIREWVGVHTEITERKKAEQELRESEERFRSLADQSPMIVFIVEPNAQATMSYFNKTWLEYTGQSFKEALGRAWDGVVHPDDVQKVLDVYVPAFQKREAYTLPAIRLRRKDGVYKWHLFKGNPRFLPNGEFKGFIGVGIDIHEQKLGEEAIKQNEAQLQLKVQERTKQLLAQKNLLNNILTNSSNGISALEMIRDESGNIIDAKTILANNAAVKFTGLPREIYLSKTASEIDPGIMDSPYGQTCIKTLRTGEPELIQYYLEQTRRWLELTVSKMDDDHLIHIFTDVTPIKEAQLQLEKLVDDLKRSNANLEEFAFAASHDLKEPIRKIHFFSDRIKNSLSDRMTEEEKNSFERMEMAAKRMTSLIDDLLTYSQVSLRPRIFEEVNLNNVLHLVLEDLDIEIGERDASVSVDDLPVVMGHHRHLQQAFQNLIGNALKYSKPGIAPDIKIFATKILSKETGFNLSYAADATEYHVIEVSDKGIGFEQKDADRIFNVFTRLHGNKEFRGTGVGLSIVRKVAENHNGYVVAESAPGEGARFKLYLPVNLQ